MTEDVVKKSSKKEEKPLILKKVAFLVGSIVYLITDPLQLKRIVLFVYLGPNGYEYELRHSDEEPTVHYDIEISSSPLGKEKEEEIDDAD